MHFTPRLATLFAVLHALEPTSGFPVPEKIDHAHISLIADASLSNSQSRALLSHLSSRGLTSGFYSKDGTTHALRDLATNIAVGIDVNASGFQLLSAVSKSSIGSRSSHIIGPRSLRGRRYHGHKWHHRLRSLHGGNRINSRRAPLEGIPGTIDIMSPIENDPVGVRLASLSVSNEPSEANEFVLNASGFNASIVYLMVSGEVSLADGSLTVRLGVPVFDQALASFVPYCATFNFKQASPLIAAKCAIQGEGITSQYSQLFSYDSSSGVLKPLWASTSPMNSNYAANATTEDVDEPVEGPSNTTQVSPSPDGNDVPNPPQNVSLIFTPELDDSFPVVNSRPQRLNDTSYNTIATEDDSDVHNSTLPLPADDVNSTSVSQDTPSAETTMNEPSEESQDSDHPTTVMPVFIVGSDEASYPEEGEDQGDWSSDEPSDASPAPELDESSETTPTKREENDGTEMNGDEVTCEDSFSPENAAKVTGVDTGYPWRFNPSESYQDDVSDFGE
ncbi:hypothetical protein FRC17_002484 [Serendipita sp. 399]|nr:hypothetical protein FRC17_002484 [Serendipita sp. 399]